MAKQRVLHALSALALAVCALLIAPVSFADSYARIVRLSDVDGSVQIDRNTGNGFEKAILNMPITQGVRVETGTTGRAEVEFENGSVIRLAGESSVEFTQLSLRSNGDHVSDIRVNDGVIYVDYKHKGDDDFRISFANRGVDLVKDAHFRLFVNQTDAEFAVFKGELRIQGPSEMARVKKNETFTLDLNDGARYELAKGITPYSSDDWDQERIQYLDQYASSQNSYSSPYLYGYSDLNRYGSFFDAPGYGLVWRPSAFGSNWDPYGDGYWSYYPGSGYVWVSSYPWGWTPYRYGQWVYLPTYGWAWRPGQWNRWNTGVTVINPPPTWHHPSPPPTGGGSTVVVGQPTQRPPRTINVDDLHPNRPTRPGPGTQPSGVVGNDSGPRRGPTPRTTGVTPPTGTATTVVPSTGQSQPDRHVDVGRQNRNERTDSFETQSMRGERRGNQQNTPPANANQPSKQMSTPPPPPPPPPAVNVQPSRPSPPPVRVETPRVEQHVERPSRMETPHSSPPPPPPPPAMHSESHPSRTTNPK